MNLNMNLNTKLNLEYSFGHSSLSALWNFISTPNGLSEWFADAVTNEKGKWLFAWNNSTQAAHVFVNKISNAVKVGWLDFPRGYYFEIRIVREELTNELTLHVSDMIEEGEEADQTLLWNTQVDRLMRCMGV